MSHEGEILLLNTVFLQPGLLLQIQNCQVILGDLMVEHEISHRFHFRMRGCNRGKDGYGSKCRILMKEIRWRLATRSGSYSGNGCAAR